MPFDAPPTRTQERAASPEQSLFSKLYKEARKAKLFSAMAAMSAFLGAGSGTPHEEHQMQRDSTSVYSTPEGRARAEAFDDRNAIIEATGNRVLPTIDEYNATPHIERNKALADIQGFSEAGYSDTTIREILSDILPPQWLEQTNISAIRIVNEDHFLHDEYGTRQMAAAECSLSRKPGEASSISFYRESLRMMARAGSRRHAVFLQIILHEIFHANDSLNSSTLDVRARESQYAWASRQALAMQHGRPEAVHQKRNYERWGTRVANAYSAWTGESYASPSAGSGYVNFGYPAGIHNADRHEEAELMAAEIPAEAVSVVFTLPILHRMPTDPSVSWEVRTALQLVTIGTYRVNPSWRSSNDAFQDALELVRFVKRVIPDIEMRQAAVQRAVERLERESTGG